MTERPPFLDGPDAVAVDGGGADDGGETPRNDEMSSGIVSGLFAVKGEEEENECAVAEKQNDCLNVPPDESSGTRLVKRHQETNQERGCVAAERDECCFLYTHIMECARKRLTNSIRVVCGKG